MLPIIAELLVLSINNNHLLTQFLLILVDYFADDNTVNMKVCRAIVSEYFNRNNLFLLSANDMRVAGKLFQLHDMQLFQRRINEQMDTMRTDVNELRADVNVIKADVNVIKTEMNDLKREVVAMLEILRRNEASR